MATAEQQFWVTMNDGVRLDVSVCTPAGATPDGGWPAVLLVHGHGDTACKVSCLARARRLAERGYLSAAYSVRGQGASEGLSFHMGPRELFDLQDMIDWVLSDLPVHADRLAVAGSSQGGWHSYMAAAHHPRVATIVPENIFTDYAEFAVMNGCLNRWFFARTMRRRIMSAGFQDLARQWALSGSWELLRQWLTDRSPLIFAKRIRCPVFILHGWHDVGMPPNQALRMYDNLQVPKKIYIGGGGHDGQDDPSAFKVRESLVDRWLDHWLKGDENGIMEEPPVTFATRPGWEHVHLDSPDADSTPVVWYLHRPLAGVSGPVVHGALQADAPSTTSLPSNIANTPINTSYDLHAALHDDLSGVGAALQREEVIFDSEPAEQTLILSGAPHFTLHVLANHGTFQVHAELYDVSPHNEETSAVDGVDRGHGRLISRGHQAAHGVAAGTHMQFDLDGATIRYRLDAGHRLRLVVANYNTCFAYPFFHNSCTRLFHDPDRPSCVEIPLSQMSVTDG